MSHDFIKVRNGEAAIYFTKDGKMEAIVGEGKLHRNIVVPFTVCYAMIANQHVRDVLCSVLAETLKTNADKIAPGAAEKSQLLKFANIISEGFNSSNLEPAPDTKEEK